MTKADQTPGETDLFEAARPDLIRLAYRMTGSRAEAEDIVQDAWLRWHRTDVETVRNPRAFLSTTVARLAIDHLRAARTRRETYVGPWLPEPVATGDFTPHAHAPDEEIELAQDVSFALMTLLESLKPEERAAFLLREAFDMDYAALAATLGKSEDACRQMVSRARTRVRAARPRFEASNDEHRDLLERFTAASATGDAATIAALLSPNVTLTTDGGGKARAALRVLEGAEEVSKLIAHLARKRLQQVKVEFGTLNGRPATIMHEAEGATTTTLIDVEDGRIAAIYTVRNPEKLARIGDPPLGSA